MPLDFQRSRSGSASAETPRRLRPPPDYFSRAVRTRLFVLVAAFMLVIMVLQRVRDPQFWQFMGFAERPIAGGPPLTSAEIVDTDVDTSLRLPAGNSGGVNLELLTGIPRGSAPDSDRPAAQKAESPSASPDAAPAIAPAANPGTDEPSDPQFASRLTAAENDAWRQVFGQLDGDAQLLLYDALDHAAENRSLPDADQTLWQALLELIEGHWANHVQSARKSLGDLPADEQSGWSQVLDQLQRRWESPWRRELQKLADASTAPDWPAAQIATLRTALDAVTLSAIQDDTVARAPEKAAWFRWLARIRDTDDEVLRAESVGPTGFLQLFKQSSEYRGKVVTVRGVATLAYRVSAPPNRTGIESYYLFWIRPAGGPNSPIVVYSLETPPGFPPIKDKEKDKETTPLNAEVEFTGYFVKRWAYESQGGIHVAPLLLARVPRWQAEPPATDTGPSALTVTLIVLGTAAAGIGFAVSAFYRGDARPTEIRSQLSSNSATSETKS